MSLQTLLKFPAAALLFACASVQAQVVVIVSAKNPISKLTPDMVTQIFLGQASTFYTGGKAEPLDLAEGSPIRQEFYTKFLGKSQAQMKAHWSKQAFSGKGSAPAVLPGNTELVKKVAENPKYIGYVDKAAVDATVKALTVQ
jgi:ABC-type phosphate transport system substrate-binding protein